MRKILNTILRHFENKREQKKALNLFLKTHKLKLIAKRDTSFTMACLTSVPNKKTGKFDLVTEKDGYVLDKNLTEDQLTKRIEDYTNGARTNDVSLDDYLDDIVKKRRGVDAIARAKRLWKEFKYEDLIKLPPDRKTPCFLAGTFVTTKRGNIPIEKIQKGEVVQTMNFNTQKIEFKPVIDTFKNTTFKYVNIQIENEGLISSTGNHKFWLPRKNMWMAASKLREGDYLLDKELKESLIQKIQVVISEEKTYNLEVKDNSNYFVGTKGVLVHNRSKLDKTLANALKEGDYFFYEILGKNEKAIYVGLTTRTIEGRYAEHVYENKRKLAKGIKRKKWIEKAIKPSVEIKINGKKGPLRLTAFEAAIIEFHEIQNRGGIGSSKIKGILYNKAKPIGESRFNKIKKKLKLNPCRFYV